jgi:hypothetical protein
MNRTPPISGYSADQLIAKLAQARGQLRALIDCLPQGRWLGPRADHLNPPLWEVGHIVWFQERWCLRARPDGSCAASLLAGADALYDSSAVAHDRRWDLPLPNPAAVDDYASQVTQAVAARLRNAFDKAPAYFAELSLYHELMHIEAWWMAFQALGYAPPPCPPVADDLPDPPERLRFAAGEVELGSGPDEGFIFDNEKWRHAMQVAAFDIDATPVSQGAFLAFVEAGGYARSAGWSADGWAWRVASEAHGAGKPAPGSSAASISGCRSSPARRCCTSTTMRPRPAPPGSVGACPTQPSGCARRHRRHSAGAPAGNGCAIPSRLTRDFPPTPIASIPNPGSTATANCAAGAPSPTRISSAPASAISTCRSGVIRSPASAPQTRNDHAPSRHAACSPIVWRTPAPALPIAVTPLILG